jgi:hypothetical protein
MLELAKLKLGRVHGTAANGESKEQAGVATDGKVVAAVIVAVKAAVASFVNAVGAVGTSPVPADVAVADPVVAIAVPVSALPTCVPAAPGVSAVVPGFAK